MGNAGKAAVEVRALRVARDGKPRDLRLDEPVVVDGRWKGRPGSATVRVTVPVEATIIGLVARNVITGDALDVADIRVASGPALPDVESSPGRTVPAIALPHGVRRLGRTARFGPGRVDLARTLVLPEGLDVVFEPGLHLRLGPGASLIVRGDLRADGTESAPVLIGPADPEVTWGTLAIQGRRLAPRRVTLRHTRIHGGAGGATERVDYTGSLSVHDGIVTLLDLRMEAGEGEDGINLKYASVRIERAVLEDLAGDALDLDFCRGEVRLSRIRRVGGDAIDMSGSSMLLEENQIAEVGDKGISVGERSRVEIRGLSIEGSLTGVALKDDSLAEIVGLRVLRARVGIGAYVKKPSFGGPAAWVERPVMTEVSSRFLIGPASALQVEDTPG